jgi:hypothetical protein
MFVNNLLQLVQTNPEIIGVEETVFGDILESRLIFVRTHGRLPQDQVVITITNSQVAALLIILGPFATFHHEGRVDSGKVGKDFQVERSAKVIGV